MSESEETLNALMAALELSPDNTVLRGQVARMLMGRGRPDEAEVLLRDGLAGGVGDPALQLALARCFHQQGKHGEAVVIIEALVQGGKATPDARLLHARLLLRSADFDGARSAYAAAIDADESLADEELAEAVGYTADDYNIVEDDDEDDEIPFEDDDVDEFNRIRLRAESKESLDGFEMEKPELSFDDVGGMEELKREIRLKIIEPLNNAELYKAYGKAIGGGILMYGPPGCGKTHLARATAGQVNASFISVGIHDVLDMYLGNSEQKLRGLFEYARSHTPCVLFFDEVDALGGKRTDMRGGAGRTLVNQMLAELDGIDNSNDGLLILGATNAPWHLDSAFRRPGRFDRILFVPPPDGVARVEILRVLLKGKPVGDIDFDAVAKKCETFSGADLKAVIDLAVEGKLEQALKTGKPEPLETRDLLKAVKKSKPSTRDWFSTAKNHAMYANEAGLYDDVVEYLKR